LKLRAHKACNHGHHLNDEKIGQMIALRRREAPRPENRKLHALRTNAGAAIINLDVDATVWRWITGFHAALYREPLHFQATGKTDPPFVRSIVLPFPKGSRVARRAITLSWTSLCSMEYIEVMKLPARPRDLKDARSDGSYAVRPAPGWKPRCGACA